ncbi:MAG: hypothetical protein EXR27_19145 [Betaproteobacteria bacterium]|nr:hypothetical protein [Betaproteobacteria bacterium]
MSKLLFLLASLLVVYLVLKGISRSRRNSRNSGTTGAAPESMVACAHCRVNLPLSEAIESAGRSFCSEDHRHLFETPRT